MATTTDVRDALVKAGVDQDAAIEIQRRLRHRGGPSAMSILICCNYSWLNDLFHKSVGYLTGVRAAVDYRAATD